MRKKNHKAYLILILLIICIFSYFNFLNKTISSSHIVKKVFPYEKFDYANISPDGQKYFVIDKTKNVLKILTTNNEKFIAWLPLKSNGYIVKQVNWTNENALFLHMFNQQKKMFGDYITFDYHKYQPIIEEKPFLNSNFFKRYSNDYKKCYVSECFRGKNYIQFNGKEIWDTGLNFISSGSTWSSDNRFLMINHNKSTYIIDSVRKTIFAKIDKIFAGLWAPTKNLYVFYTDVFSYGFSKKDLYLFDIQKMCFKALHAPNKPISNRELIWSPDSRYLLVANQDKLFYYDLKNAFYHPKLLFNLEKRIKGNILPDKTFWSSDGQNVLLCYRRYEGLLFGLPSPVTFYAVKIDISTGKKKEIKLFDEIGQKFIWLSDSKVIFEIQAEPGLYMMNIKW